MKVAVITPYYKESLETLLRCHDSVRAQTHPCTHIMIADGHARPEVASWEVDHIVLPFSHGDYGNTPRTIGATSALNRGFDAVAYLDGDNWLHPEHVESLVAAVQTEAVPLAFAERFIVALDGTILEEIPSDIWPRHVDTNCIFHTMQAARLIPIWAMMEPNMAIICDKVFWWVAQKFAVPFTRTGRQTIYYETNHAVHYEHSGHPLPADPRSLDIAGSLANYSQTRCQERMGFSFRVQKSAAAETVGLVSPPI